MLVLTMKQSSKSLAEYKRFCKTTPFAFFPIFDPTVLYKPSIAETNPDYLPFLKNWEKGFFVWLIILSHEDNR